MQLGSKKTVAIVISLGLVAVAILRCDRGKVANDRALSLTEPAPSFVPQVVHPKILAQGPVALNTKPVESPAPISREEMFRIFEQDDVCALDQFEKQAPTIRMMHEFFLTTPFRNRYLEYESGRTNEALANSYYSRFLAALAKANWLEPVPREPIGLSPHIAFQEFRILSRDDLGNAAPAAFALALAEDSKSMDGFKVMDAERDELLNHIHNSNRFDTYALTHMRELASWEDDRAISQLLKISYLANHTIPNWTKFRSAFSRTTADDLPLRLKVTDLMMINAKNAKAPSKTLSYSVLESAIAKAIAGNSRNYPTFREIDDALETANSKEVPNHLLAAISSKATCDASRGIQLRAYIQELRRHDLALGLAF